MVFAIAWPCAGPGSKVRRISRSRVPCKSSMRSLSLVDILGENIEPSPVECQGEGLQVADSAISPLSEITRSEARVEALSPTHSSRHFRKSFWTSSRVAGRSPATRKLPQDACNVRVGDHTGVTKLSASITKWFTCDKRRNPPRYDLQLIGSGGPDGPRPGAAPGRSLFPGCRFQR
jgi:hypothetical protein